MRDATLHAPTTGVPAGGKLLGVLLNAINLTNGY